MLTFYTINISFIYMKKLGCFYALLVDQFTLDKVTVDEIRFSHSLTCDLVIFHDFTKSSNPEPA